MNTSPYVRYFFYMLIKKIASIKIEANTQTNKTVFLLEEFGEQLNYLETP
jgi:hypothetical protein